MTLESVVRNSAPVFVWKNIKKTSKQEDKSLFVEYSSPLTTGPFSIPFYYEKKISIDAKRILSNGQKINLFLNLDFTLDSEDTSNGNLTLIDPLLSGQKLFIRIEQAQLTWGKEEDFQVVELGNPYANLYNPTDPATGLPYYDIDPTTGIPIDPDTGLPFYELDPVTGEPIFALDPITGLPKYPIDPVTGLPINPGNLFPKNLTDDFNNAFSGQDPFAESLNSQNLNSTFTPMKWTTSTLTWQDTNSIKDRTNGYGYNSNLGSNPADNPSTTDTPTYKESGRTSKVVKITNPQDSQQWVEVEQITSITFDGIFKLEFNG